MTVPLFAQQSGMGGPGMGMQNPYQDQKPFTSQELSRFMRDWPDVVKWLDSHGRNVSNNENPGALANMFAGSDFVAYLNGKGWKLDRFGYVTVEVALCLTALAIQEHMPSTNSQIQDSINQIQSNPNMTDAQKKSAIEQMKAVQSQMMGLSVNVPQSELSLVKPKQDELKKILDINTSQD